MCGINAFFSYNKITKEDISKVSLCNKNMLYRGPDENDIWYDDKCVLGQVRLSIIGVTNGHQPLFNEDKSLVLICNGEIYNYKSLKNSLQAKGHIFSSDSDSEVILHLYEEYGESLNKYLDGMFAFCLYDIKNCQILVARDHSGIKPLYYAYTSNGIVFSSELKVIKNYFFKNPEINHEVLRQTQQFSYPISEKDTYIKNIHKIPYSSYAKICNKNDYKLKIVKYFKKEISPSFNDTYESACKQVKDLLFGAVEKRLQSEVPLGILLSAGIDSSAIATISREFTSDINVLSAGYVGNHSVDERFEAKKLSDKLGCKWHEILLNEKKFKDNLNTILPILDEPNGDIAMFPQWEIYKKAKEFNFTVLLSGNGGDELFFGYKSHNDYALSLQWLNEQKQNLPKKNTKESIVHILYNFFKIFIRNKQKNPLNLINSRYNLPVFSELDSIAKEQSIPLDRDDWHRIGYKEMIDNVYHFLNYAWLTNNCYFLADKLAMANSIEMRSPFSDLDLIKFVNTLPIEYRFHKEKPKQLLKDSLKGVLPDFVLNRKKTGFTPPISYVDQLFATYENGYFKENSKTLAQLTTDYFAKKIK
jgi:asparagine synthase (glutamine-hydrolysing)